MRQGITPGSGPPARGRGMDVELTPCMVREDVWI